jgi:hypothetical protein
MMFLTDCETCTKMTNRAQRQSMGCGYEPPSALSAQPWQPPGGTHGYNGPTIVHCAGYTTNLPEVDEAARARFHWDKGALGLVLAGEPLNENLQLAIEMLESASNRMQHWRMTPVMEGGGGS